MRNYEKVRKQKKGELEMKKLDEEDEELKVETNYGTWSHALFAYTDAHIQIGVKSVNHTTAGFRRHRANP